MQFPMAKMLDIIAPPLDIHPASFPPPPVVPAVYFKFWPHIVVPSPIVMGTAMKTFVNGMPAAPMSSKTISFHWPPPPAITPVPESSAMQTLLADIPGLALKVAVTALNIASAAQQMAAQGAQSEMMLAAIVPQAASAFAGFLEALGIEPIAYYHMVLGTPMVMVEGAPAGFALFISGASCNAMPFNLVPLGFVIGGSNVMVGVNIGMALFQYILSQALGDLAGEGAGDEGPAADATMMLEPINVVSGAVHFQQIDFHFNGPMVQPFMRHYLHVHTFMHDDIFGPGWHHNFDHTLQTDERNNVHYVDNTGQAIQLPYLKVGEFANVYWRQFLVLRVSKTEYHIRTTDRKIMEFNFGWTTNVARMTKLRDLNGNAYEFNYEGGAGRLMEIKDPQGRIYRLNYWGNEKLKEVRCMGDADSDEDLVLSAYEYDELNRLVAAYDYEGNAHRYTYNDDGLLIAHTNRLGYTFHYEYNEFARCSKSYGEDGVLSGSFEYLNQSRMTTFTDHKGDITQWLYDENRKITCTINPDGTMVETVWDEDGLKVEEKNELMKPVWKIDRDKYANAVELEVDRVPWTFVYNGGNLVAKIDPYGNKWVREYDRRGNLVFQRSPLGHTWNIRYDDKGNVIHKVDPRGIEHRYDYDHRGNMTKYIVENKPVWTREYDLLGHVSAWIDALGRRTELEHDPLERIRETRYFDGSRSSYDYDAEGNLVRVTDRCGNTVGYRYGSFNFLAERIEAAEGGYKFDYDQSGKLILIRDGEANETQYEYDQRGRLSKIAYPFGYTIEMLRDVIGNITEIRQNQGTIVQEYTEQGWIAKKVFPNSIEHTYEYNKRGQYTKASTPDHEVLCIYDEEGQLKSEKQGAKVVFYGHDELGNVTSLRSNWGFSIRFTFDDHNRVKSCKLPNGDQIEFRYDALGRPVEKVYPNGINERVEYIEREHYFVQMLKYRSRRQAWEKKESEDELTIFRRVYYYNEAGCIMKVQESSLRERMYTYDPSYQLLEVKDSLRGHNESFQYDRAQNLTYFSGNGNMDYEKGLCMGYGGTYLRYDDHGNLIERSEGGKGLTRYSWDIENRLRAVTLPSGKKLSFEYDALGRRISKTLDGRTTRYVWAKDRLLMEQTENETPVNYVYYPGGFTPMLRIVGKDVFFYHNNSMGSPILLSDQNGEIVWEGDYAAFGELTVSNKKFEIPHRFQGQYGDPETGLYYNFNRYYDPKLGRYLSPDPMGHAAGLNLYRYCRNPINEIDPLGLCMGDLSGLMQGNGGSPGGGGGGGGNPSAGSGESHADFMKRMGVFPGADQVPAPFSNGGPRKTFKITYRQGSGGGGGTPAAQEQTLSNQNGNPPGPGNGTPGGTQAPSDASPSQTTPTGGVEPNGPANVSDPSPNDATGGGPASPPPQKLEDSGQCSWDGNDPAGGPAKEVSVKPAANDNKNAVATSPDSADKPAYKGTSTTPSTEPKPSSTAAKPLT